MISIVLTHFNRRKLLMNTLRSIEHYRYSVNLEIIIVDDNSDPENRIGDIGKYFNFPVTVINLNRGVRDPVIPYNTAFNIVQGDKVLISCAECLHMGDILGYIDNNLKPGKYLNFATYSVNNITQTALNKINYGMITYVDMVSSVIDPKHELPAGWKDGDNGWYISKDNGGLLPFCAAISRTDLENLSGYDERFVDGVGHADSDFVVRVKNLGLQTEIVQDPYCIHQNHKPTNYHTEGKRKNEVRITDLNRHYPVRIKAINNTVYNPKS